MKIKQLFQLIGKKSLQSGMLKNPTLVELGITQEKIEAIDTWAQGAMHLGKVASYIPELEKVNPKLTAIAIGDLQKNTIVVGSGSAVVISIQSVIKPFLYIYALERGVLPEDISGMEASALAFNADRMLNPELSLKTPDHPLNNAGAISSAGAITDFNDFLGFMRKLTGNKELDILQDVYTSEMNTNSNNKAIAHRMVGSGRFKDGTQADIALENYTKACAIGVTVADILRASLTLASGGINVYEQNLRQIKTDNAIRTMSAMNSFGLYGETGEVSLWVSGVRANTCKSGVGGIIINIDPGRGAFVTYSPLLDSQGNSIYGLYANIALNNLLSAPGAMRLSTKEIQRAIEAYGKRESV